MKSILGALLFDKKPVVPEAPYINAQEEQLKAIRGNLAALPDLEALTSQVNAFSIEELQKALEKTFPGYASRVQKAGETIDAWMRGEIPADVIRNIRQFSAERATSSGTTGSSFATNQVLRNLGLTSLDLVQQGLGAAERWIAQSRAITPQFNFTSMFVTPAQQIATAQFNETSRYNVQWLKNQIKAIPEGWQQAVQGLLDWVATSGSQVVGAYAGGAVGGGGGGGIGSTMGGGGGGGNDSYASLFSQLGGYQNYQGQNFTPQQEQYGYNMLTSGGGGGFI